MATGRVLSLHVGTHKTGTTSFQEGLSRKAAMLAQSGTRVWPEKNAWRLANVFLRPTLVTSPRVSGKAVPATLADLQALPDLVRQRLGDCGSMIISSEEFCMMRDALEAHALLAALGSVFERIVPIVVLRNVADWKASREDQLRKTGMWDLQKGLADMASNDGAWYYDREAIVAFWTAIGPVQVIDYDAACATEGSVMPALARAFGYAGLFDDMDLRLNVRDTAARA
jgi:hypothetical protein